MTTHTWQVASEKKGGDLIRRVQEDVHVVQMTRGRKAWRSIPDQTFHVSVGAHDASITALSIVIKRT